MPADTGTSEPAPPSEDAPKLASAWLCVLQAELMLNHLAAAGATFPHANLYCHACVTAMRSVTFMLQKALRPDPAFDGWYSGVQEELAGDSEFVFLREARNYVLKEGSLELMASYSIEYSGGMHIEMHGIGPDGPDIWVGEPGRTVPADWRKLEGLKFDVPLRLGRVRGLPEPPARELRKMLADKLMHLRLVLHDAEWRFDAGHADEQQAKSDRITAERMGVSRPTPT